MRRSVNRFVVPVLLALYGALAQGAVIERGSVVCPDGSSTPTASTSECRPHTTAFQTGAELVYNSTNITATVNVSSGTFYTATWLATDPAPADCAAVIAGSGAVDTSSKTITANAVDMSGADNTAGLSELTNYVAYGCPVVGVRLGDVQTYAFQTPLDDSGGGGQVAGQFVVKADGGVTDESPVGDQGPNTSGCGSMAAACYEFSHLNPSIGEDVWVGEGSVFEDRTPTINDDGQSGDRAVWGCFRNDASVEKECTDGVSTKPELNGTYEDGCRTSANTDARCPVTNLFTGGLTVAQDTDFVTIQDLSITKYPNQCLRIEDDSDYTKVDRVNVNICAHQAIEFRIRTTQMHVKGSSFGNSSICYWHYRGKYQGGASLVTTPAGGITSSCDSFGPNVAEFGGPGNTATRTYGLIEDNDFYNDWVGEVVGLYDAVGSLWVINNRSRNARRGNVYWENTARILQEMHISWDSDVSVEADAIVGVDRYGSTWSNFWGPDLDVKGYDVAHEAGRDNLLDGASDIIIRNSLCAGASNCNFFAGQFYEDPATQTQGIQSNVGVSYYHMTSVGYTGRAVSSGSINVPSSNWYDIFEFVNGVSYSNVDTNEYCVMYAASSFVTYTMGPNGWEGTPSDTDCQDAGDVAYTPTFARDRDTWREADWTTASGPTFANAVLQAGDSGLSAGDPLQDTVSWLTTLRTNLSMWADQDQCPGFTGTNWDKKAAYDAGCNLRNITNPSFGAMNQ